ncbi:MAG: polysaccharide biosynthesis/export family protein [Candidatus Abyssubacteria bacterium]|nr:polysaccharide biosynthesis/export family protein [Candidatus Abyssubacteria bacterium]
MPENNRKHGNPSRGFPVAALLCAVVFLAPLQQGCGTTAAQVVNNAAAAQYVSVTDDASRLLAQSSQGLLTQRSEDYRVGPEDVLETTIFEWELREETKTVEVRVAESGIISLPVLGDLEVRGLSVSKIGKMIERRLFDGGFIREPRVSVIVKEFRSKRVAVVVAVVDPGVYTLRQNVTTLLDILSLAGGLSERAGYALYVIHAQPHPADTGGKARAGEPAPSKASSGAGKEIISVDLYELLEMGNLALNAVLRDGDIVNVPEAKRFAVIGFVGKPGSFPLKKPTSVLEGIALAEGVKSTEASLRSCMLRRQTPGSESLIPLDLVAISEGQAENLYLMPNDIIEVRQTVGKRVLLDVMDGTRYMFNVGYTIK